MTNREKTLPGETEDALLTFSRIFDHGAGLPLRDVPPDGSPAAGLVLFTSACKNPACTCTELDLLARPIGLDEDNPIENEAVELRAVLDVESGEVSARVVPDPGSPGAALLASLRRLVRGDQLEAFRARWARAKRQDDADEWKETDWSRVDLTSNVPFFEVFPSRWDIALVLDRQLHWVVDLWCLKPGCSCTEVGLDFLRADGGPSHRLVVDLATGKPARADGSVHARRLWEALHADKAALTELKTRQSAIRRVARLLPARLNPTKAATPAPLRAGRNEPCPCGSGKKFKRCCGGFGAR